MRGRVAGLGPLGVIVGLGLGGCGTSVGNPTGMRAAVAPADDLTFEAGLARVRSVTWYDCAGGEESVSELDVDVLAGGVLPQPEADFCEVTVAFSSQVQLEGSGDSGGRFVFHLDVGQVSLVFDAPVAAAAHDRVFELASPGWVNEALLGIDDGSDVIVERDSAAHDALVAQIRTGSGLYGDLDDDGAVSDEERAAGP